MVINMICSRTSGQIFGKTARKCGPITMSKRPFWVYWLNLVSNKIDPDRVKEVGGEQACGEWLVRNGVAVRWSTRDDYQTHHEDFPVMTEDTYIQSIKGDGASLMAIGFEHFKYVRGPEKVMFRRCHYLEDEALEKLEYIKHSLRHLQLISCHNISDEGVCSLTRLRNLRFLKIFDLSKVKDLEGCRQHLLEGLPECAVDWGKL